MSVMNPGLFHNSYIRDDLFLCPSLCERLAEQRELSELVLQPTVKVNFVNKDMPLEVFQDSITHILCLDMKIKCPSSKIQLGKCLPKFNTSFSFNLHSLFRYDKVKQKRFTVQYGTVGKLLILLVRLLKPNKTAARFRTTHPLSKHIVVLVRRNVPLIVWI